MNLPLDSRVWDVSEGGGHSLGECSEILMLLGDMVGESPIIGYSHSQISITLKDRNRVKALLPDGFRSSVSSDG